MVGGVHVQLAKCAPKVTEPTLHVDDQENWLGFDLGRLGEAVVCMGNFVSKACTISVKRRSEGKVALCGYLQQFKRPTGMEALKDHTLWD